jgi:arabinofuranosyltransferase
MAIFVRRRVELIGGGVLLLMVLGLAILFINSHSDRGYITYRYALNFASGYGLVYNPGQPPVLSEAISPLYAFILGLGALLTPDLPTLSNILGVVATLMGGLALYGLAQPAGKMTGLITAGVYVTFPLLWISIGLETATWMALSLGALWLHQHRHGIGTAALLVLAVLVRPEAIVLAVIVAADALATGRSFRFWPICIYAGGIVLGELWTLAAYQPGGLLLGLPSTSLAATLPDIIGSNVFAGLATLGHAFLSPIWLCPALMAGWGMICLKEQRWAILLASWGLLHVLSLAVLRVGVFTWTFMPLVPALAALIALGLWNASSRITQEAYRWMAFAAAAALYAIPVLLLDSSLAATPLDPRSAWQALAPAPVDTRYVQAGAWLRSNAPVDARVGAACIGVLGYWSGHSLVDYHGSLQPEVADALARGDSQWWLADTRPEYIVLTRGEAQSLGGYDLSQDAWFTSSYAEVARFTAPAGDRDPLLVFQRQSPPSEMSEMLINYVTYPDGLTVNGIAADFSLVPLESGRVGLVRLEWLVDQTIAAPQYVAIQIQGRGEGAVAGLSGRTIDFSSWPHRRLSTTYHPIEIAAGLPPGVYDIQVGIGPDAFHLDWQTVGQAKVPFQGSDLLGGISGARTEFGDVALLGYRLARTDQGLEVFLLWEAVHIPQADYRILVQVRGMDGTIAVQDTFEPHSGSYPTSIWSAGEQVPDVYLLDISIAPSGSYQVYVSLLNRDDSRILTMDGRDALFVGQMDIP